MSLGRNTVYNVIGAVVPLVLALVTIPIYLHLVGTERYGALAIAWLILGYFGMFDMGLGRATTHRIAELHDSTPEHRASVFWTAATVNIGIGIVGGVLLYFGADYFFRYQFKADAALVAEALESVPLLAMAVPIATLTGVASGALQGRERFLEVNINTVIGTTLFQLLPLAVAFWSGPTLKWLIVAAVVGRIMGFLLMYARVHQHMLRGFGPMFDRGEWLSLLKFGGWVSITFLIGPAILLADRLLIGSLIGAVAVAVYAVAFDIAQRISLLPKALGQALFPRIAQSDDATRNALMIRSLGVLDLVMTAPVIFVIFIIGPFLELWVGPETGSAATLVCRVLLIAYWANAFGIIPFVRLQAQGRPDIVTWIILCQTPIYLAALYFALEHYGLVGAACVVAARSSLEVFVLLFFANRSIMIPRFFIANAMWLTLALFASERLELLSLEGIAAAFSIMLAAVLTSWFVNDRETRKGLVDMARAMLARRLKAGRKG